MGKPNIGQVDIPVMTDNVTRIVKNLTILEEGSKESIYSLIFLETEDRGLSRDE